MGTKFSFNAIYGIMEENEVSNKTKMIWHKWARVFYLHFVKKMKFPVLVAWLQAFEPF